MSPQDAYLELEAQERRIGVIGGAQAMLSWDQSVMMPDGGAEARADQMATLGLIRHELATAPARAGLIALAEADASAFDSWQHANLEEISRQYRRATAVNSKLVEALSRARSQTEMVWRKARQDDDFAAVAPKLADLLALVREEAAALGEALGLEPYDALLDGYDSGLKRSDFAPLFDTLASEIPPLLVRILEKQAKAPPARPLGGPFPVAQQQALSREIVLDLGFDFNHGRLDVSHHPFSGGTPDDSRITTRYDESECLQALMATIHETGHSHYERGLPAAWRNQPVGAARGMTLHESQSLSFEMQFSRNPAFLTHMAARMRSHFGRDGEAWSGENIRRHAHLVTRGFIRVYADEVTYPLHVILRFELEQAMIAGDLAVKDLPEAWREGMVRLLGRAPDTDREGCLQDIHWFSGAFGYFPTYTLGALAAAQLFAAATTADPEIFSDMVNGSAARLLAFMRENVHKHGCSKSTTAILQQATGAALGTEAFLNHLRTRYLGD